MDISLTKLPWWAQVAAFVVLAGGGLSAFYYYYEQPMHADLTGRQNQLSLLRADMNKGYETARRLPAFKTQVIELEGRLDSLKSVLPDEKDAADLLRHLETVATQSHLVIKSFKPSPIVTRQLHAEWPISLELEGTYHNLAIFFDRVGKFTRIVNISGLDVKNKPKPEPNSTITASCVATTFVLLDKAAIEALAAKAKAAKGAKGA